MSVFEIILLIINRLSLVWLILIAPFALYDFFFGRERAERIYARFNFKIKWSTIDNLSVGVLFVAFITFAFLKLMGN